MTSYIFLPGVSLSGSRNYGRSRCSSPYFDGLIEGEYETVFSEYFAACEGCRRLVEGLRESLEEQDSVETPEEFYGRIFAATSKVAGGSRR
ncbi:MAG TPA: hypothetical protein VFS27_05130 [Blastocatellia bacterium]|nr:hypothetical protein [Blastocatellia bacterium]